MMMTSPRVRFGGLTAVMVLLALWIVAAAPRAAADPLGTCAQPPTPDVVSSGMTGMIDPTQGQGLAGSIYLQYGYAGQVWHTFDAGDSAITMCAAPEAEISTWLGNLLFDGAKVMVAMANGLHYLVYDGGLPSTFDQIVATGAQAAYSGFAAPFIVLALLIVGIGVLLYVLRGDHSGAAKSGGRVAAGLALVAATAFSPLMYTALFDNMIIGAFQQAQAKIANAISDEPDEDVVYRHVLPTTLHREIVYENWLRGEFGKADSPLATKLGDDLVWAQSCSWSEVRTDTCDVQAKQQRFTEIAKKIKAEGHYVIFTGADGSRVGIGALALFEASIITPLQITSKLGILLAQIVLRVVVLFGPLLGILAMAPGVARRILKGVLGVGALGLGLTIVASLHSFIVIQILDMDNVSLTGKLMVITLITMLIWTVARPVKRVKSMMASSMYAMPGQGLHHAADWLQHSRMMHALRKKHRHKHRPHFDKDFWLSRDEVAEPPSYGDDTPGTIYATATRPEAAADVKAVPAALPAGATNGSTGTGRGGAGSAGPPPGPAGPRGGAPSGSGAAARPPTGGDPQGQAPQPPPIRAEATVLTESDDTSPDETEPGSRSYMLPASPHRLPPGTATSEQYEQQQAPPDGERSELVTPSEVLSGDDPAAGAAEQPQPTGESGERLYKASSGQLEPDPGPAADKTPGERPEAHEARSPEGSVDDEGESDADPH